MSKKSSIVTFALAGLAIGTAAYFLFGTREGRKQLDCAGENLKKFSDSVRTKTREGAEQAARLAEKASRDIQEITDKVKSYGKGYLDGAQEATDKLVKKAEQKVKNLSKEA